MKLKDNSAQEIDTALYQLEQRLKSNIRLTDVENSNASTAKINAVDKKLTEEVKDRQSADEKLQDNINKEIADRKDADAAIENAKQDKLIAGDNIQINGNVISATSTEYTAEAPVKVTDGKISLDTVPITKGGTGVTTQADINKAFIGNLEESVSDVTDGTEFVSSYASDNGFNETTEGAVNKPYKRQFIKVWNYIKGKISSVLGLTASNYGGTADKAVEVVDYGDTLTTVRIGYRGPGITADKLLNLAGYTELSSNSVKLKDVNKEELIKWLGIPRIKYADYSTGNLTFNSVTDQIGIELSNFGPDVTEDNVLSFMVIRWSGIIINASGDWAGSPGLKCALHALSAGTGQCVIRCVYMV